MIYTLFKQRNKLFCFCILIRTKYYYNFIQITYDQKKKTFSQPRRAQSTKTRGSGCKTPAGRPSRKPTSTWARGRARSTSRRRGTTCRTGGSSSRTRRRRSTRASTTSRAKATRRSWERCRSRRRRRDSNWSQLIGSVFDKKVLICDRFCIGIAKYPFRLRYCHKLTTDCIIKLYNKN